MTQDLFPSTQPRTPVLHRTIQQYCRSSLIQPTRYIMMAGAADDGERTGTHGCSSSVSVVGQFDAVDIASAQGVPETYRVASYRHTIYTHIYSIKSAIR